MKSNTTKTSKYLRIGDYSLERGNVLKINSNFVQGLGGCSPAKCFGCGENIEDHAVFFFGHNPDTNSSGDFFLHTECAKDIALSLSSFLSATKDYISK